MAGAYDQIKVIQEARKRRKKALRLRRRGKTLQEIADALGLASRQRASQLVDRALSDERINEIEGRG